MLWIKYVIKTKKDCVRTQEDLFSKGYLWVGTGKGLWFPIIEHWNENKSYLLTVNTETKRMFNDGFRSKGEISSLIKALPHEEFIFYNQQLEFNFKE